MQSCLFWQDENNENKLLTRLYIRCSFLVKCKLESNLDKEIWTKILMYYMLVSIQNLYVFKDIGCQHLTKIVLKIIMSDIQKPIYMTPQYIENIFYNLFRIHSFTLSKILLSTASIYAHHPWFLDPESTKIATEFCYIIHCSILK